MPFPNLLPMETVTATTDMHSMISALRGVAGDQSWSHGLDDGSSRLDLIRLLRSATNLDAQISVEDAVALLVKLNMVDHEFGRVYLKAYSDIVHENPHMTVKALHALLSGMSTRNPNSTEAHKREVESDMEALDAIPDTEMTVGAFLQVLDTVFTEPKAPPVESA